MPTAVQECAGPSLASAAGRSLEELAPCTGASAARQVPLMPRVSGTRPCPAAQPYLQQLPPPCHYF